MSWWDTLFDLGSSALGFAKENPTLTGAALGLVTGGFKGDYGENNLRNTAVGGALGYAAGQAMDYFRPGAGGAATAPNVSAAPAPTASTMTSGAPAGGLFSSSNPSLFSTSPSNASITGDFGGSGAGGGLTSILDKAQGGLNKVQEFGKKYGGVADVGLKIGSAITGQENARKQRELMDRYAAQRDQAAAENRAITDKQNALTQQRADEYMAMDPNRYGARAYASTVAGAREKADAAEAAEMSKGYSPATAAANKRRALLGASTSGVTAADSAWNKVESARRAGLSSISYDKYDAPSYDANYIKTLGDTANAETQGVYKLGEDILGINKTKAKEQVQQDQLDR